MLRTAQNPACFHSEALGEKLGHRRRLEGRGRRNDAPNDELLEAAHTHEMPHDQRLKALKQQLNKPLSRRACLSARLQIRIFLDPS